MTRYAVTRALSSQTFHRRIKCVHTSGIGYRSCADERPRSVEGDFPRLCSVLVVARCAGLTALPDTDVALLCDGPLAG